MQDSPTISSTLTQNAPQQRSSNFLFDQKLLTNFVALVFCGMVSAVLWKLNVLEAITLANWQIATIGAGIFSLWLICWGIGLIVHNNNKKTSVKNKSQRELLDSVKLDGVKFKHPVYTVDLGNASAEKYNQTLTQLKEGAKNLPRSLNHIQNAALIQLQKLKEINRGAFQKNVDFTVALEESIEGLNDVIKKLGSLSNVAPISITTPPEQKEKENEKKGEGDLQPNGSPLAGNLSQQGPEPIVLKQYLNQFERAILAFQDQNIALSDEQRLTLTKLLADYGRLKKKENDQALENPSVSTKEKDLSTEEPFNKENMTALNFPKKYIRLQTELETLKHEDVVTPERPPHDKTTNAESLTLKNPPLIKREQFNKGNESCGIATSAILMAGGLASFATGAYSYASQSLENNNDPMGVTNSNMMMLGGFAAFGTGLGGLLMHFKCNAQKATTAIAGCWNQEKTVLQEGVAKETGKSLESSTLNGKNKANGAKVTTSSNTQTGKSSPVQQNTINTCLAM